MTKIYMLFIGCLLLALGIHYLGIYDLKMISIGAALVGAILLVGGDNSNMRTYSSMDIKNIEYDNQHRHEGLSLVELLKLIIPIILYMIFLFLK